MTDGDQNKLGEVLRTAREAREVDLARVERDTKIRARYLQALEDGDYAELPGAVYTKGFLRNYGAYLGLDTEYLIDLYRLESSQPTQREAHGADRPPRPISTRRSRALVITPGAMMAALLTVGRGDPHRLHRRRAVTFAAYPGADITQSGWREPYRRTTSWSTRSSADRAKLARSPSTDLRENPTVDADAERRLHASWSAWYPAQRHHAGGQRPTDGSRQRRGHAHHRGWR